MTELKNTVIEPQKIKLDQVFDLLDQEDHNQLQLLFNKAHPGQLADILEAMPPKKRKQLWELMPESQEVEILTLLNDEVRNSLRVDFKIKTGHLC